MKSTLAASVIIPNWNGKHLLEVCLKSLQKQTFKDFEIVLVDNGSTDGSSDYIEKNFPNVKLVVLDKNYGFAAAVNKGIKASVGRYIILLNNDTEVDKDCLKYLIDSVKRKTEFSLFAAKMLNFYNREIIDSAGDYIDAVGHANNIGLGQEDNDEFKKEGEVFLVTGGGCLIKREVFEKIGLFDEDYFAYFEDVDFGLRAQMAGYKAWYQPKAIIYHIHKATSQKNRAFLEYLQFRNMMQTIIKDFPYEFLKKDLNLLKIILVNLNTIRFLGSEGFLISALKAEGYILLNLPKLFKKRSEIQKNRKVSVEYIIKNIRPRKIKLGIFSF